MPYTIGLHSAAAAFLSAGFATQFSVAIVICLVIVLVTAYHVEDGDEAPQSLPGPPFLSIFQLMNNTVIVLSGASARRAFFNAKGFDLTEGFKILSGAIPMVRGVTSGLQTKRISVIHKRLAAVQKNVPLSDLIPAILEDSRRVLESYGTSGTFDPFEKIYELMFQTTVRCLSSAEIADDAALVARLKTLYDRLDAGTTPATVLFPWLPTPAMIKKLWATKEIYDIVVRAIEAREQSGISKNDTLQMLVDSGDEKLVIVGFIMGLLIAGARATGTTASWMITFLGGHADFRQKAKTEVESLLGIYSDATTPSLSSRLAEIPLEVWESQAPVLDAIIRETLRLGQPHAAMRRNLGPEVYINDKLIPSGAYIIYRTFSTFPEPPQLGNKDNQYASTAFSDVHLDPTIYPDPWRFDPSRKEVESTANLPLPYVGWGVGKTTCLGTRLAKVELKLTVALFLLGFDHVLVDKNGNVPLAPPETKLERHPSMPTAGRIVLRQVHAHISRAVNYADHLPFSLFLV
ncbi:Lanosterol 14-alpha demethylase [Mycena sanguinolenta]|uniref:Lanosterol 14-alpha demethylase n=1 Tax=Mycena sanguinolenta TaxID=230812 RepID=A0A8H6XNY6_9AGAR|nr:Lanosterol 14-alpha demethylase [Mycena sanguinolenta]